MIHETSRRRLLPLIAGFAASLCLPALAQTDGFPNRPIRLVVPFAAGGNTDVGARLLAQGLALEFNQSVVVDNKVGAGTIVGTEDVARAKPDGYTLLLTTIAYAVNPSLYKNLRYDSKKDLVPVAHVSSSAPLLLLHPSVPASNIPQLVDYLKKNPGTSYGSAGNGSAMHLHGELFRMQTSAPITHIPYKSESPALVDLIAGRTMFHFGGISSSAQYVKSGALKAIAIPSQKRTPLLPDVPTAEEAGLPGFLAYTWSVVLAPAGTPPAIIDRLNAAMNKVSSSPEVNAKLVALGYEPITDSTPASTGRHIASETVKWGEVVKRGNLTVD
ncbi:MAG: tripartite tricarboxylate transporter substrate binding protein [Polaromonas sp.]|jgi:tripartite-type tricarboxylate transporter receptor subunit TctC|nr:tripartite tricarboxylate transporter substrate binding protein [Polaromonas sp.]